MNDDERWRHLVHGFQSGDPRGAQEFWDEYGPLLHRVAHNHLAERMRRRVGADDVVQSVCRTFFRRLQGGELKLTDGESLWKLLCAITLHKVREQARFHNQQRRGLDREVHASPQADDSSAALEPMAVDPSPATAIEFAERFEQLLASLDEIERQVVDLRLQELTQLQIAEKLDLSERTVRRVFQRIHEKLKSAMAEDA